jgi:hypothetical protein
MTRSRAERVKLKKAARKSSQRRGRELDGVIYVRTEIPDQDLVSERDLILHTIDESIATLQSEGCDVRHLTVVTFGTSDPKSAGRMSVEVKSRLAPGAASIFKDPAPAVADDD